MQCRSCRVRQQSDYSRKHCRRLSYIRSQCQHLSCTFPCRYNFSLKHPSLSEASMWIQYRKQDCSCTICPPRAVFGRLYHKESFRLVHSSSRHRTHSPKSRYRLRFSLCICRHHSLNLSTREIRHKIFHYSMTGWKMWYPRSSCVDICYKVVTAVFSCWL